MIKALKNTLTFDLYKNNKEWIHHWLWVKRVNIMNSGLFWMACAVLSFAVAITTVATIHNMQEIATYDYSELMDDKVYYAERVPAYYPMLQEAYADGIITNGEYSALKSLTLEYWEEVKVKRLKKVKKDLTKQLK